MSNADIKDKDLLYFDELLSGRDGESVPERDNWGDKPELKTICTKVGEGSEELYIAAFAYLAIIYSGHDDALINVASGGKIFPFTAEPEQAGNIANFVSRAAEQLKQSIAHADAELADPADIAALEDKYNIHRQVVVTCSDDGASADALITACIKDSELKVTYRADHYTEAYMQAFTAAYGKIVEEFKTKQEFAQIVFLTDEEEKTLDSYNATERDVEDTDVVTLFRRAAATYKDKPAVVCGDESYTYGQVDDLSDRIAAYIRSKGYGKGDVVSVLIPRCSYMVIASLGVLKAGCAYQPLDPGYPTQRLTYMMTDASVKFLIAGRDLTDKVPEYKGEALYIEDIPGLPENTEELPVPDPDDLFILLYTSGTTGNPKGVLLMHHNLVNYCFWYQRYFSLDHTSNAAAYASYGFDANMMDLYPTLTAGATVYVIPEDMRLNLMAIEEYFEQNNVTHAFMTTQVGRQFAEVYRGTTLKCLSVGGERLTPIDAPERIKLFNVYGPTETTIVVTVREVDKLYTRIPIGKPVDNAKIYIIDKMNRRLPTGAIGELCIAGRGVSSGYLNLPDKTAAAFTPNPFNSNKPYDRIYHTGDVVRILPGGDYDFIGRNDGQVKIRGFRIELSEVEAEIRKYKGIKDCTVQAFDYKSGGGKFIAAYLVSDEAIDTADLAAFIKRDKPAYMVPQVMLQIDSIPLTRNQKVDKRALPEPVVKSEEYVKPETDTQKKLFDMIASVLGHDSFGINTDLFDAGLTSIAIMRLMVHISEGFGVSMRIKDVKDNPTIEQLEKFIASGEAHTRKFDLLPDYPLTKTQEGILVECMSNPDTLIYNIPILIKLDKSVDLDRLERAVRVTVDCHPYMKMHIFANRDGDFRAERRDDAEVLIERLTMKEEDIGIKSLAEPFELQGSDLYRIKIIESDNKYLYMDVHHIIADGESYEVLVNDIESAYNGTDPVKEKYSGFEIAIDEMRRRESEEYTSAVKYYEDLLDGVETDNLPPFDRNDDKPGMGMLKRTTDIDMKAVRAFLAKNDISENALFSGAFAFLLSRYNNKNEAVYTTIYNGRGDVDLMHTVDMLVKTLPMYVKTEDNLLIKDYLQGVSEQFMNNMQNDIFSFAEISHKFGVSSEVLFAWQGAVLKNVTIGGKHADIDEMDADVSKFKLNVNGWIDGDRYTLASEYQPAVYNEGSITWFLRNLEQVVKEFLVKDRLGDVDICSPEAAEELDRFNDTRADVEYTDVVTLFRRAAAEHADKTAAVCGDESLTYGQIDNMSDRIAVYIASKGLGREDAVSVLIPRAVYMTTCSIGVSKAGCAYQPLDPGYPEERLNYMMKDAGVKLLITTRDLRSKVAEYTGDVLYVEDLDSLPEADKNDLPEGPLPESLFILLYTSGTTGLPKGVMLEHHSIVNFCRWYQSYMDLTSDSKAIAYASYGFDANMMDMYPTLTAGATLHIIPEEMRLNLPELNKYFNDNGITHAFMTTQVGRQFREMYKGKSLKTLSVGGEKLVPIGPADGYRFINGYGPTECTIFTTVKTVDQMYLRVPIGSPLSNTKLYVVGAGGKRLPVGAIGELCVAGYGVGRGYLNLPDKTAAVFTPNPFSSEKGYDRIYHTGDVVRMLPNGEIDFIGRNDGQVKVRGFRIELGEVEEVIRRYPELRDVTVQAFDDPAGGKYIAAYVVSDHKVNIDALRAFVGERKPSYMIPAAIMQIDSIPLNQNQKVNRRALPVIEKRSEAVYEEPKTALEREVCTLYADILGLARVGATDNFFEIGGSSIIAAKIIVHAMNKGYKIVYKDIFDNPTPRALAKVISGNRSADKDSAKQLQADDYDYTKINEFIAVNSCEHLDEISFGKLNNIILCGATGFLGMHVLRSFIENNEGKVYCLMRRGRYPSAERRLMSMLSYYFEDPMNDKFGSRIICVDGDITEMDEINKLKGLDADVLINCAACVKHFVEDDLLDRVNYYGVKNLIRFCVEENVRLVQTSTYSVAGEMSLDDTGVKKVIFESQLYFGQNVENDYIRTKFLAERAVLEARVEEGLNACIVRLGNLMSRRSDGEFQINFLSNAFMRSLKAYKSLGQFPMGSMNEPVEFSPIDTSAAAVLKFATADKKFSVFHGNNNHTVTMADVIYAMKNYGFKIDIVSDEEFSKTVNDAFENGTSNDTILGLVAYDNKNGNRIYELGADNSFSINALYRGDFKWPIIDDSYLDNAIVKLDELMFFDDDESN